MLKKQIIYVETFKIYGTQMVERDRKYVDQSGPMELNTEGVLGLREGKEERAERKDVEELAL